MISELKTKDLSNEQWNFAIAPRSDLAEFAKKVPLETSQTKTSRTVDYHHFKRLKTNVWNNPKMDFLYIDCTLTVDGHVSSDHGPTAQLVSTNHSCWLEFGLASRISQALNVTRWWWFQPTWNILVKVDHFPQVGVKINHHLGKLD